MMPNPLAEVPDRSFWGRGLPHPLLTIFLVLLWVALMNDYSLLTWTGAITLGLWIPIYTGNFWPGRPKIRSPLRGMLFLGIVMCDIVVANIQVAYLIVFRKTSRLQSRWVSVPIELTSSEAIAVLMGTITLTPGTVSSDISGDGRAILVHCLDVRDKQELVDTIKNRYESRLKEIFP